MFDNEFWRCPSYTYSTFLLLMIFTIVIYIYIKMQFSNANGKYTLEELISKGGSVFTLVLFMSTIYIGFSTYILYKFFNPNPECAAKGFPGQHYMNPFYSAPKASKSEVLENTEVLEENTEERRQRTNPNDTDSENDKE